MIPERLQHTDLLSFWHQHVDWRITKKDEEDEEDKKRKEKIKWNRLAKRTFLS